MTIFYPDISSYQAGLSLNGALAVSCKATEGTSYFNSTYGLFKAAATALGIFFFGYHFLRAGNAAAQANYCFSKVGSTPVMLDFEPATGSSPSLADACAFIDQYRKLGGNIWLAYLPRWYWSGTLGAPSLKPLSDRGMLIVSSSYGHPYSDSDTAAGWQPYGGIAPTVWQYTDALKFNGYSIDFNAYRGTLEEFRALVTTGKLPAPPPPPPPLPPPPPVISTAAKDNNQMIVSGPAASIFPIPLFVGVKYVTVAATEATPPVAIHIKFSGHDAVAYDVDFDHPVTVTVPADCLSGRIFLVDGGTISVAVA